MNRSVFARAAIAKALRLRSEHGWSCANPGCVFDLAAKVGVDVRFEALPSMEGIYFPNGVMPIVLVSALRPPGRRAFNAAHELGHHVFGHGAQFDELVEERSTLRRNDPDEYVANCFAGELLMPKAAVSRAFAVRKLTAGSCCPEAVYVIATYFGVGFGTLVNHMCISLGLINRTRAEELLRNQPLDLRGRILGAECRNNLVVADTNWVGRAIDLEVGDLVCAPPDVLFEGRCTEIVERNSARVVLRAVTTGIGRLAAGPWASFVRVSRKDYAGRAVYRFEEEVSDGE